MAQQNKAQDPLAAAMSAIEDALNLSHEEAPVDAAQSPPGKTLPLPAASFEQKPSPPPAAAEKPAPARAAAQPTPTLKPAVPPRRGRSGRNQADSGAGRLAGE